MTTQPEGRTSEEIRRDIDSTRGRLSEDVNTLTDTVNPKNVARRQASRVTDKMGRMRDSVMGSAEDLTSSGQDAMSSVGDTASSAKDTAVRRTEGNPMA